MDKDPRTVSSFQSVLLELLAEDLPIDALMEKLKSDESFAAFQDQIALWEPRMVRVASDLVKKWGKRGKNANTTDA